MKRLVDKVVEAFEALFINEFLKSGLACQNTDPFGVDGHAGFVLIDEDCPKRRAFKDLFVGGEMNLIENHDSSIREELTNWQECMVEI